MMAEIQINQEANQTLAMNPKKFAIWLLIVATVMVFAALTSAYIVQRGEGKWLDITLPPVLWLSTFVILLSSVTLHIAYLFAKKNNLEYVKIALIITTVLGCLFLGLQLNAWGQLVDNRVWFGGHESNPAGSYLYIFTGLHAAHLISGIIFLIIVLNSSFKQKIHSKKLNQIEMCCTYWHFLDFLWVYLFVFLLLLNH